MATTDVRYIVEVEDAGAIRKIQQLDGSFSSASASAKRTAGGFSALTGQFARMTAAFATGQIVIDGIRRIIGAVSETIQSAVRESIEYEKQVIQLEARLRSTGNAAGMTRNELLKMADALQRNSTYANSDIISAENLLLTFTSLKRDILPQATETVLDMSVALTQGLKESAIQVGKALQDPILGVSALRRVGVNFTKDQGEMIKKMVETGRVAEAQRFILNELSTEFGGAAAAAANTYEGRITQLKNAWHDLLRELGNYLTKNKTLIDGIKGLTDILALAATETSKLSGGFQVLDRVTDWLPGIGALKNGLRLMSAAGKEASKELERIAAEEKKAQEFAGALKDVILKNAAAFDLWGLKISPVIRKLLGVGEEGDDLGGRMTKLDKLFKDLGITTWEDLREKLEKAKTALAEYRLTADPARGVVEALEKKINDLTEAINGSANAFSNAKRPTEDYVESVRKGMELKAQQFPEYIFKDYKPAVQQASTIGGLIGGELAGVVDFKPQAEDFGISIKGMVKDTEDATKKMADAFAGCWNDITSGFVQTVLDFKLSVKGMGDFFIGVFDSIKQAFFKMIADMIAKWLLFKAITGLASLVGGPIGKGLTKAAAPLKFWQTGFEGVVTKPTLAMIAESGPEQVSVRPLNQPQGSTRNNNVSINLTVTALDGAEVERVVRYKVVPILRQVLAHGEL